MVRIGNPLQARPWRIAAALVPGVVLGAIAGLVSGPLPQALGYHQFADRRVVLGVPHAGDVLSNLAFVVVGAWGLWFLSRPQLTARAFIDSRERRPFRWLFAGVFLTGLGSAWYHWNPDNYSLAWDRLAMVLGFMGVLAAMIAERVSRSLGVALLGPLVAIGVTSVLWWIWTEHVGHGDLRWYLFVQFYTLLSVPLMLLLLPTPYTHGHYYWGLLSFYVAAKVAELADYQILDASHGLASGHSLKHLFAALGAAWLLRMLWLRQPCR